MTYWIAVSIIVPALPILIGIVVAILQESDFSLLKLLDGIELLLISLGLVAATHIELSRADFNWTSHYLFYFFIRAILFALGVLNLIFLTLIYINNRVTPLNFNADNNILLAIGFLLIAVMLTAPLQFYMGYTRAKISVKEIE